jgi:hypothetical protein
MVADAPEFRDPIYDSDGRLRMASLVRPARVAGLPCAAGRVLHWHDNGQLAQCDLAEPEEIAGHRFNANSIVCFDDAGRLESVTVFEPTRIAHHDIDPGSSHVVIRFGHDGALTEYASASGTYGPDGRLRERMLRGSEVVQGIPCTTGVVRFDDLGRICYGVLGEGHRFGSMTLPAGSTFTLIDGVLRIAMIPQPPEPPVGHVYERLELDERGAIVTRGKVGWTTRPGCESP